MDKPPRKRGFFDRFNEWTVRGGFMLAGAWLGIPGLGAIAGSAIRNSAEFAGETISIALQPGETAQQATDRLHEQLGAQGIEGANYQFDDETGQLLFDVPADAMDSIPEILGESFDMVADGAVSWLDGIF